MKKEIYPLIFAVSLSVILVSLGLLPVSVVAALTPTPTVTSVAADASTSTDSSKLSDTVASESAMASSSADIRKMRDKLASMVAQMLNKERQVVAGELKSIEGIDYTIDTLAGSTDQVAIDEVLTKYYRIVGAAKEELQKKDIKIGQYVIVTGLRTDGQVTANEIFVDDPFDSKAGRVTEIDSNNYTFKLETFDKETITINIDRSVTQEALNIKTLALEPSSFIKIKEGDVAHVVFQMKSIKQALTTVTPVRMLVIPSAYFNK